MHVYCQSSKLEVKACLRWCLPEEVQNSHMGDLAASPLFDTEEAVELVYMGYLRAQNCSENDPRRDGHGNYRSGNLAFD
jgi:hypothetical protein